MLIFWQTKGIWGKLQNFIIITYRSKGMLDPKDNQIQGMNYHSYQLNNIWCNTKIPAILIIGLRCNKYVNSQNYFFS